MYKTEPRLRKGIGRKKICWWETESESLMAIGQEAKGIGQALKSRIYINTPYEDLIAETRNHHLSWATRNHIPNKFTRCPSKSRDSRVWEASTFLGGSRSFWIFNYHKLAVDCPLTWISLPFLAFKFWIWSKFHYNIFTRQRRTYKNTCQNLMNKIKECEFRT